MAKRFRTHVRQYAHIKQRDIVYGSSGCIEEVEVDEVTFSRYASGDPSAPVAWIGYIGMVARGKPETLKLLAMPVRHTSPEVRKTPPQNS
eukprot:10673-Amphidinium_carterae.1